MLSVPPKCAPSAERRAPSVSVESHAPAAIFVLGHDGRIIHANASFKALIGWDNPDVLGPLASCPFWPSESAAADIRAVITILGAAPPSVTATRLTWMRPSGQRLQAEVAFTSLRIDGVPLGLFCEVLGLRKPGDIAVWLWDMPEGRLVQANAACASIWAPDLRDLPATNAALAAAFEPVMPWTGGVPEGGRFSRSFRIRRPDGTMRWMSEDVVALRDAEDRHRALLGMAMEIPDRLAVEIPVPDFEDPKTFGNVAGLLAHEFNNLMSVILHDANALAQGSREPGDRKRAERIAAKARHAAALTASLLAATRSLRLDPRASDLRELLGPVLRRILDATGLSVPLVSRDGGIEPCVRVDPGALGGALVDLASAIRLVARAARPQLDLDIWPAQPDGAGGQSVALCLAVRDCPEIMVAAQDGSDVDGWTLRIAAALGFAKLSGGALRIHVLPHSATTVFELSLPQASAVADGGAPKVAAVQGLRVLVVDDDEDLADAMRESIERAGHVAMCCGSAAEALARLEVTPCDVVVSDISMPGMSGAALLQIVQARWPAIAVVLMTGFARESLAGIDQSGTRILQKPVEIPDLLDAIAEAAAAAAIAVGADRLASD
jgi:PAS domain S-box-containing protein